jgi:hypothetical protein
VWSARGRLWQRGRGADLAAGIGAHTDGQLAVEDGHDRPNAAGIHHYAPGDLDSAGDDTAADLHAADEHDPTGNLA